MDSVVQGNRDKTMDLIVQGYNRDRKIVPSLKGHKDKTMDILPPIIIIKVGVIPCFAY